MCDFNKENPDFLLKNPDLLIRNVDFLLKNVDFIMKTGFLLHGAPEAPAWWGGRAHSDPFV